VNFFERIDREERVRERNGQRRLDEAIKKVISKPRFYDRNRKVCSRTDTAF